MTEHGNESIRDLSRNALLVLCVHGRTGSVCEDCAYDRAQAEGLGEYVEPHPAPRNLVLGEHPREGVDVPEPGDELLGVRVSEKVNQGRPKHKKPEQGNADQGV
jgi:hypothetical protein